MASYFYIVPFKNKRFFKLGISSGTRKNLLKRFNDHLNGFQSEGIEIDVEKIEYVEFKNAGAAGFIEREMKAKYGCSKICTYGSTEIFNLELLPEVKNEVAQFSLNYGGADFQSHNKTYTKTTRIRASKKNLSEEEQRLKNERLIKRNVEYNKRLTGQLESENIQKFKGFSRWFDCNKNYITSIHSSENGVYIDMNLYGLEIGCHLEDGEFIYPATIWDDSELFCHLDGTYNGFCNPYSHFFIDPNRGWFEFRRGEFLKIYNSRPDLWGLLPAEIRNVILTPRGL